MMDNSPPYPLSIAYNENYIEEYVNAQFLGSQIDNYLKMKCHVELINLQHVM
jgi:hypothetical protein